MHLSFPLPFADILALMPRREGHREPAISLLTAVLIGQIFVALVDDALYFYLWAVLTKRWTPYIQKSTKRLISWGLYLSLLFLLSSPHLSLLVYGRTLTLFHVLLSVL